MKNTTLFCASTVANSLLQKRVENVEVASLKLNAEKVLYYKIHFVLMWLITVFVNRAAACLFQWCKMQCAVGWVTSDLATPKPTRHVLCTLHLAYVFITTKSLTLYHATAVKDLKTFKQHRFYRYKCRHKKLLVHSGVINK